MMRIDTPKNEWIKSLAKLSQKKYRDLSDELLVEGEHLIEEARSAGLLDKVLGVEEGDVLISESVAEKLSTTKSGSKIFGVIKRPQHTFKEGTRYLVCDRVQDPGNVGTLIRSAYSFGFDGVILSKDSADEYNDKTIRSSQGAVFHISVIREDLDTFIPYLKEKGISVIATHVDNKKQTLSELNKDRPLAIVLGSEGEGVSDAVLSLSDETLHIETSNFESLNVSVAGGIITYALRK